MMGRPITFNDSTGDNSTWKNKVNAEIELLTNDFEKADDSGNTDPSQEKISETSSGNESSSHNYLDRLKAARNVLLNHIFDVEKGGYRHSYNRHLFAVLAFSQMTMDVEVRDDEAKWPTDSLRFAATVLRILLDSIAGIDFKNGKATFSKTEKDPGWEAAGEVYLKRLRIAGRKNREKEDLWNFEKETDSAEKEFRFSEVQNEKSRDVTGAPCPLYKYDIKNEPDGENRQNPENVFFETINYLGQFKTKGYGTDFPNPPNGDGFIYNDERIIESPNRYDFYLMILSLVEAILKDTESSLWIRCRNEFDGHVGEAEMRRLTLLILMMLPALINEQLEYDYIRIKRNNEVAVSSKVISSLMKKCKKILNSAAIKTGTPWNAQRKTEEE